MSNQYWSDATTISAGGINPVGIATGGGTLTITLEKGSAYPITGVKIYLFSSTGSYLGHHGASDENGLVSYVVSGGDYKVRADYQGYQFWTDIISVSNNTAYTLTIPHQEITVTVRGDHNGDLIPKENLKVYLFTPSGSYLGQYQVTDGQGQVGFSLPERDYKVRADYLSKQYWSDVFNGSDQTITINEGTARITVTNVGLPVTGVKVYVFTTSGSYLGLYGVTDESGDILFRLPEGPYNFRADYMGNKYWSGEVTIIPHVLNPVEISTGGGPFNLTVEKRADDPLSNVKCYLFNAAGSYLGEYEVTNDQGEAGFNLADGTYKIRIDYLGYQFWTDMFTVPTTLSMTYTMSHQQVSVTVAGDNNGDIVPRQNLNVYLFTPSGAYLGQYQVTDAQGQVSFSLPLRDYKVRADYLSKQYWSEVFNGSDQTITINEGIAEVSVTLGSSPLNGVKVYLFNASGSYLGIYGTTDQNSIVAFRVPEGTYKFRADYQGSQYWVTEPITPHQVNVVNLNTGGGTFDLTVQRGADDPMTAVPVYVFTSSGSYIGMTAQTDAEGKVSFDLGDGDYKFRVDYLGYQFWTDPFTVPLTLSETLTIAHQPVTISVENLYQAVPDPIQGIKVYLFTESGSYMGKYAVTNDQGQVSFDLPDRSYKVRADYLGYQFWSAPFDWTDTTITINHGKAVVHVTEGGWDVIDAPVYLFKSSGSYLGRYERTDTTGRAEFELPEEDFKFRVDHEGTQYWTDVISIIPNEENLIELNLDLLALNKTNDPLPSRYDGEPPIYNHEGVKVAALGSLTGILTQGIISEIPADRIYYYINDHLGTPQKMIDEAGEVVWSADYKPFGDAEITINDIQNNFRFPGQFFDQETGLNYNYHRYYDPRTGRYLRPDPIGLLGGINPFLYASGNPINNFDPEGLINWGSVAKGGASVVFGSAAIAGGIFAASTPTGIGQALGITSILAGSSGIGFGVSQIIAGFMDEDIPSGIKEAIIKGTTSGQTQTNLLAANELVNMLPGILSGRLSIPPSKLGEVLDIIQYGISIGKSATEIQQELEKKELLKQTPCEQRLN